MQMLSRAAGVLTNAVPLLQLLLFSRICATSDDSVRLQNALDAQYLLGFLKRCHGAVMVAGYVEFLALSAKLLDTLPVTVGYLSGR